MHGGGLADGAPLEVVVVLRTRCRRHYASGMQPPRERVLIGIAAVAALVAVASIVMLVVVGLEGSVRVGQTFTLLGAVLTMSSMLISIHDGRKKRRLSSGERRD